jgi:hypothetical protein
MITLLLKLKIDVKKDVAYKNMQIEIFKNSIQYKFHLTQSSMMNYVDLYVIKLTQ